LTGTGFFLDLDGGFSFGFLGVAIFDAFAGLDALGV
jgi:hypothetical protein